MRMPFKNATHVLFCSLLHVDEEFDTYHGIVHTLLLLTATADMKKKLYGGVLLVGGGLALPGAAASLQSRLETRVPQGIGGVVEVFANPRVWHLYIHYHTLNVAHTIKYPPFPGGLLVSTLHGCMY